MLKILVIAYAIARLSGFLSAVARGIGIVGIEMKSSLTLVLIKLPLSYFLIASYGVQGAAVAVLIAVTVSQSYFLSRFVRMVEGSEKYAWLWNQTSSESDCCIGS